MSIIITEHARLRLKERFNIKNVRKAMHLVNNAMERGKLMGEGSENNTYRLAYNGMIFIIAPGPVIVTAYQDVNRRHKSYHDACRNRDKVYYRSCVNSYYEASL